MTDKKCHLGYYFGKERKNKGPCPKNEKCLKREMCDSNLDKFQKEKRKKSPEEKRIHDSWEALYKKAALKRRN
jgi:hypothetical protein